MTVGASASASTRTPPPAAQDGQALCLACGLCCKGVWFAHVALEPDEIDRARQAGLHLETLGEKVIFHQPCVLHQDNKCSAYGTWRPATCVKFRCALLEDYESGQISLERATTHVASARALADRVFVEAGSVKGGLVGKAFTARLNDEPAEPGQPQQQPLTQATKLDAVALKFYYRKFFKKVDV